MEGLFGRSLMVVVSMQFAFDLSSSHVSAVLKNFISVHACIGWTY